jgi:hypothetical protein
MKRAFTGLLGDRFDDRRGQWPRRGTAERLRALRVPEEVLEIVVALFGSPYSVPKRVYQFRERVRPSCS